MGTLFILIIIQIAGIAISLLLSFFRDITDRKEIILSTNYKPTGMQSQESWQWLIEYFQEYPDSLLKHDFPDLYKVASAIKRYKEINRLKIRGKISEREYENKLEKILPLIDIRPDLKPMLQNNT